MSNISNLFLRGALVFFATGVGMGVFMSMSQDFSIRPVHVHVNLLGWVAFFLFAVFYRMFPEAGETKLAKAHFWSAVTGLPPMMLGLWLVINGVTGIGLPLLLGGELLTVISVALFVIVGFRATASRAAAEGTRLQPAE